MNYPLITVYITNYNYGNYIENAIESVLGQTFQNFELIIIDDGSQDNSREIIEKYRTYNNVNIIYQQNKGLNKTNNVAISVANGKYIIRLDADDYFEKSALQVLSEVMEANPEIGLVFPDYYIVDDKGYVLERFTRHDFTKEVSLFDQAAHGACTMIRADFLKNLKGYNENYSCQDGYELWIKFINKYQVSNVNQPLFNYRRHNSNLTNNERKILSTRALINKDFVASNHYKNKSIAIIPIRGSHDLYYNTNINGTTLLNLKVKEALQCDIVEMVIISTPDTSVFESIEYKNHPKVILHQRSTQSAKLNQPLDFTVAEVLEDMDKEFLQSIFGVLLLDIQFPLLASEKIEDAVNTMIVFKADSLVSVRAESSSFYVHNGAGMNSIFDNDKKSKVEREILYKHVGGIIATTLESFNKNEKILNGKIGHMLLDKSSSYKVENRDDIHIVESINEIYHIL